MWLFDVIKDGCLVDNGSYRIEQGVFTKGYLHDPIELKRRAPGQRWTSCNDEAAIWQFLNSICGNVDKALSVNAASRIVLFNNEDYEHNASNRLIDVAGADARNFILTTGNLIGYVKLGDYSLKVGSRFGDCFLQYIIADADGFLEVDNLGGEGLVDGYRWLLAFLWNIKFKRAYRLGLPKTYATKTDRTSRVRGTIDAVDYFRNVTSGKYLCSYREHSYRNSATALFVKAYEAIESFSFCQHTRSIYRAFLAANQGAKRSRREILNTPFFTNPFYNDYNVLIDLSKRVINDLGDDFGSQRDSSAYMFDISMLFEYFIRKLIKRGGVRLLGKFERKYQIPTAASGYKRKLEPDLIIDMDDGICVFDVKYKIFDKKYGVGREDLFQLHTYIGQYGNDAQIRGCGFIFPISEDRWKGLDLDKSQGLISDEILQHGKKIPFYVLFLKVPVNTDPDFVRVMNEQCRMFVNAIRSKVLNEPPITG